MPRLTPLLAFILVVGLVRAAEPAGPVSVDTFFRASEISQPRLSKDGTRVVFLVRNMPHRRSIATWNVKTKQGAIVFVPNDYNVDFAFWKGDRIVFGGDVGGNESYALRSIKADGSDLRDLSESIQKFRRVDGPVGGNVFSELPNDANDILIAGYGVRRNSNGDWEPSGEFGFYKLNVTTGRRTWVENWATRAVSYFVDDQSGEVYGRAIQSGREEIYEIKNSAGEYKEVGRFPGADVPWSFAGVLPGGKKLLLQIRSAAEFDRGALFAFDRDTHERGDVLYQPPGGEIADIKRDPAGRILGITYEAERHTTDWFDRKWATLYAGLVATFPGKRPSIQNSTDDARLHVVFVYNDRDPGSYFLYDAVAPALTPIGRVNPLIDPSKMAERKPITYQTRDGLTVHGYCTRPTDRTDRPAPLVLIPHGGPFGIRDSWHFDPEAEFLASRGYAVLQVNYRGSGGYGAKFQEAGKRKWGREMQDDLTDAVKWAIAQHITTADQVAIYGGSYGGYAALAGLVFTPELYRCGINYVGVADLNVLVHPIESKGRGFDLFAEEWIGSDSADLRDRSPVNHIANIRVPSMHAYGENDPRVDIAHWKLLEHELKAHNKPYVFIRERDEGHGFEDERSRIHFYTELIDFLGKYLPAKPPAASIAAK
jgi:dipeptidyl aminopeptidase/acylaminoacyl peptidase